MCCAMCSTDLQHGTAARKHGCLAKAHMSLQCDTGPNRRQLKVKDPLKFNWRPKELLPQLANIYLHLERADTKSAFSAAIAASDRYHQDMFPETCEVTHSNLLQPG